MLVPGLLYATLSLILSSNRLFSDKTATTLFLLNVLQLLNFGVTIAKYAADQMLLSKLHPGESAMLGTFFVKRVLPLSLIYCAVLAYTNSWLTALFLMCCIPVEVFVIIVILELNITKKYSQSLMLNIIGYPLILITYIVLSLFFNLQHFQILLVMIVSSAIKCLIALKLRNKKDGRDDVLILSPYVPVQQAGNYVLFKADQLIIATNLIPSFFFNFTLPGDYLFYSKFTEVFSGVATSLSPILAKHGKAADGSISAKPLFKNKLFVLICLGSVLFQILVTLLVIKKIDSTHLMLLVPFVLVTLLIVPVNMLNYEYYRTNSLRKSTFINFFTFAIAAILVLVNLIFKSPVLFASIVAVQLIVFLFLSASIKFRKGV